MNLYAPQQPAWHAASFVQKELGLLGFWGCGHPDVRSVPAVWCRRCGVWEDGHKVSGRATDADLIAALSGAVGNSAVVHF